MLNWRVELKVNYYPVLRMWWEKHGFSVIPYSSIPETIFVAFWEDTEAYLDLYAIPVYTTNTDICIIGFPTSNPIAPKQFKSGALEYLMENLEWVMKDQGYRMILTTSGTPALMELFEKRGFTLSDTKVNYYTKKLE